MLIDTSKGLELCGGDHDIYDVLLAEIYKASKEKQEVCKAYLEAGNMKDYAIEVHAMKGLAANIGAEEPRLKFYDHELKGKADDAQYCRGDFDNLITLWNQMLDEIEGLVDVDAISSTVEFESNGMTIEESEITEKLGKVAELLDDFEDDDAMDIVKDLLCYELPETTRDRIMKIYELIDDLEYTKAVDFINSLS